MRNLVWFRSDLRTLDNQALHSALESGETHACIFLPVNQLVKYGHGERKIHFLRNSCQRLSSRLKELGISVTSEEVDNFDTQEHCILNLCREQGIKQVFWNNEYPLDERRRDLQLEKKLEALGIQARRFDDSLILPPHQISTGKGEFYRVFTPFKRAWISCFEQQRSALIEKLDPLDKPSTEIQTVKKFVTGQINNYKSQRDFPVLDATSHISACLSAGTVSPLRALAEALASNRGDINGGSEGISSWISQLIWREFYYHLIARCNPISKNQPFIEATNNLNWNAPDSALERWKKGDTGIPIVDAGMRQLLISGWMHNRLRMITAMFLSKNLFIDWRYGEKHFLQHLQDGDFALNNGGWQWSASTGTDAAPYFRVFNPFTQAQRFDPDARFIKQFVPELESLPADVIHSETKLARHRPESYPEALVNTVESRKKAIAAFKNLNSPKQSNPSYSIQELYK